MPEQKKTNKKERQQDAVMHVIPPPVLLVTFSKGLERVWVKPGAKIRAVETTKRREKKTCQPFFPATRGEQVRTVKNVKEAGETKVT